MWKTFLRGKKFRPKDVWESGTTVSNDPVRFQRGTKKSKRYMVARLMRVSVKGGRSNARFDSGNRNGMVHLGLASQFRFESWGTTDEK